MLQSGCLCAWPWCFAETKRDDLHRTQFFVCVFYNTGIWLSIPETRINQVADSGDGDEDEDEKEEKDEIPNYAVLLTVSVERFGVSHMRDFLYQPGI